MPEIAVYLYNYGFNVAIKIKITASIQQGKWQTIPPDK